MTHAKSLPDPLCFPLPPARLDRTLERAPLLPAVAARDLEEVRRWRDAVAAALETRDPALDVVEHLTPRARARLALFLAERWDPRHRLWALTSDYDLAPFPAPPAARATDVPMRAVLEVMRWRAGIVHYLTDVWDVLGPPDLEMGECAAIGAFMRPARLEGRCIYCLSEYEPRRLDPEDHGCPLAVHPEPR